MFGKFCAGLTFLTSLFFIGFSHAAPDEIKLGRDEGYPVCKNPFDYRDRCKVGSFSNPSGNKVDASKNVLSLTQSNKLKDQEFRGELLAYKTVNEYFEQQRSTSLMILKGTDILYENYQYDRSNEDHFRSHSMSKTLTSLLVGIALEKGVIDSIDDPTEKYLSCLKSTQYGGVTIRQLLRMSSGVGFEEKNPKHLNNLYGSLIRKKSFCSAVSTFSKREFEAGKRFSYKTADTAALGAILSAATNKSLAELTESWIWKPAGMESTAYWMRHGKVEHAGAGFFATARDWARLGLLLANDGSRNGSQKAPNGWKVGQLDHALNRVIDIGYGYQTWVLNGEPRMFLLLGQYGQMVFVYPEKQLVMVQTGVSESSRDIQILQKIYFWQALTELIDKEEI